MRIGWATPFNADSAAGLHALEVVREMRGRGLSAEIVRTEAGAAAQMHALSNEVPVRQLGETGIASLRDDFDLLVVALAAQFDAGSRSLEILRSIPSVGVFYDADLTLPSGGSVNAGGARNAVDTLANIGPVARPGGPSPGEDLAWMAMLCAGGIVHGRHYLEPVKMHCPGPAIVVPPYVRDPGKARPRRQQGEFTIVAIDPVTANTQIDRLMRAVAQSPLLRSRAAFRLIGKIAEGDRRQLLSLAGRLDIRPPEFNGQSSDERLQEALEEAHVACCLQNPNPHGGSASLVRALHSGIPVVVADAEPYADVPGDLVWKVTHGEGIDDLTRALESIEGDQAGADSRGAAAREWACRTHSIVAYVDKLVPFLEECLAVVPMIEAGRKLGTTLDEMGASVDDPVVARVGRVLQDMFKPEEPAR
jgi:hypothetical protein